MFYFECIWCSIWNPHSPWECRCCNVASSQMMDSTLNLFTSSASSMMLQSRVRWFMEFQTLGWKLVRFGLLLSITFGDLLLLALTKLSIRSWLLWTGVASRVTTNHMVQVIGERLDQNPILYIILLLCEVTINFIRKTFFFPSAFAYTI